MLPKSVNKASKTPKRSPLPQLERPPKGKVKASEPHVTYVYRKDAFKKVKIA